MKFLLISATVLLSGLILIFGYYGYPVRAINDGAAYLVPAVHMAETGKLESPITWMGDQAATSGPFLTHMPFFQILLHFFVSPESGTAPSLQVFILIAIINAIVIAISAWGLYLVGTSAGKKLDWPTAIIICAALFMIFRASFSFGGRDETLVRLFFTIGFLLALKVRQSVYLAGLLGILLGASMATSAFAHLLFAAFIGFVFAVKRDPEESLLHTLLKDAAGVRGGPSDAVPSTTPRGLGVFAIGSWKSFQYAAIAIAAGILAFISIMQLSPYSILATYNGLLTIASATAARTLSIRNPLGIFKSSYVFLYAIIGILVAFVGIRTFLRAVKNNQVTSPLLAVLSTAVTVFYVAFVVINGFRLYYIAPFLLVLLSAILYYVTRVQDSKFIKYSTIFLFAALVFVSLEHVTLFPFFLKNGKTLSAARAELEKTLAKNPNARMILGGPRMWALSEDYDRMTEGVPVAGSGNYLFIREEEAYPTLPATALDSCALQENFYTSKSPKLFGRELARVTPGYGFAVYSCRF